MTAATVEDWLKRDREEEEKILEELRRKPAERVRGLVGYRIWDVTLDPESQEPVLRSTMYTDNIWKGPVFQAHALPSEVVGAGIYTFSSTEYQGFRNPSKGHVSGCVALIGDTLYCYKLGRHLGYRSEKVRIKELFLPLCAHCLTFNRKVWADALAMRGTSIGTVFTFLCQKCLDALLARGLHPKFWGAPELQKLWGKRYQCEVLPAPKHLLPEGFSVFEAGGLTLIFDPNRT